MHVGRYRPRPPVLPDNCFAMLSSYANDRDRRGDRHDDRRNVPRERTATESADLAATLRIGVMRLSRRIRVERSGDDLTFNQLSVLGTLSRYGALPVGELAAHENVKPPSMTRTVACLEDIGLVTRRASPTDGRQVVVDLTERPVG